MDVQTKAYDLAAYTIEAAGNEKVVAKRNRWSLGNRLVDTALELAGHIDNANSMLLNREDDAAERRMEQRRALAATFRLMTLVNTARRLSHFDGDKHLHWTELVKEEQELLRGWMESDRKRIKELQ